MATYYADSSALAKLILPEPETEAVSRILSLETTVLSSGLSRTEVLRGVKRSAVGAIAITAMRVLFARIAFIPVSESILDRAGSLDPPALRSLDAIHLATVLSIGPGLDAVITYDRRIAEAAKALGLAVLAPA